MADSANTTNLSSRRAAAANVVRFPEAQGDFVPWRPILFEEDYFSGMEMYSRWAAKLVTYDANDLQSRTTKMIGDAGISDESLAIFRENFEIHATRLLGLAELLEEVRRRLAICFDNAELQHAI